MTNKVRWLYTERGERISKAYTAWLIALENYDLLSQFAQPESTDNEAIEKARKTKNAAWWNLQDAKK